MDTFATLGAEPDMVVKHDSTKIISTVAATGIDISGLRPFFLLIIFFYKHFGATHLFYTNDKDYKREMDTSATIGAEPRYGCRL